MPDSTAARTAMVDCQVRPSDVTAYPIIAAMLAVPRERFVPPALRPVAYADQTLELAPGRVMLDPRTFAKMIDAARIGPDDVVLDVGCGLGYSAAVLARMAAAVVAVESDAGLARAAQETLADIGADNAVALEGALAEGAADNAPYDAIVVEGGVEALPDALLGQLRDGGRLVMIAMSGAAGRCEVLTRDGDAFGRRAVFDVAAPVLDGFEAAAEFVF